MLRYTYENSILQAHPLREKKHSTGRSCVQKEDHVMSSANTSISQGISIPPEVNKLALVVGVNNSSTGSSYRPDLKHAEEDAEDMTYLLKQPECSFTLLMPAITGENATSCATQRWRDYHRKCSFELLYIIRWGRTHHIG